MTTSNRLSARLITAGVIASSVAAMALPAFAHAATFAYVNQSMEVRTVVANDWMSAIATAPNIDEHSGVLLLINPNSSIVGSSI
jgi:hypothetical protein